MRSMRRRILVWLADEGIVEDPAGRVTTIIGEAVGTSPSYAGMLLARLAEQGLVERRYNPIQGRTFQVKLTAEGRDEIGREGHVNTVVRPRAQDPLTRPAVAMPVLGAMTRVPFDADQARERALGGVA